MSEVDKVLESATTIKAMGKLKKDKVEISVNPKKVLLESVKEELAKLESQSLEGLSEQELKIFNEMKKNYIENIEKYSQAKIEGILVPLKYKDTQTVKDGILEAVKYSRPLGFDDDITISRIMREEHTLTVFLSLRKKEDISQRYYATLEEIVKEPDSFINELYSIYQENFVLTDEERKNS